MAKRAAKRKPRTASAKPCPITGDASLRADWDARTDAIRARFPRGVARPALRALLTAGITRLEQLKTWREADLAALHGMGPKAMGALREALQAKSLDFKR
jgi:hypothetical protein